MVDPIVLAAVVIASLLAMVVGALIATPFVKSAASEPPLSETGGLRGRLDPTPVKSRIGLAPRRTSNLGRAGEATNTMMSRELLP